MLKQQIDTWVNEHQADILSFNKELIAIPSVNRYPSGDELNVQTFIEKKLRKLGCDTDTFIPTDVPGMKDHPAFLEGRDYKDRPNVVGVKKGTGGGQSILFSGHVDTVSEGEVPWSVDPYAGTVKAGKQYGLGILDMKGGMSAAIIAMKMLEDMDISLKGDFLIETVVDEEFGGANGTLASRLKGYEADIAIIPEPSNMVIAPANQSGSMFRVTFSGRSGRAFSGEDLVNPIYAAGRFIDIFHQFENYQAQKQSTSPLFQNQPGLPAYIQGMNAGPSDALLYDRVPSTCSLDIWIQAYPETTEQALRDDFVQFYEKKAKEDNMLSKMPMHLEKLVRFLPGTQIPEDHGIIRVAQQASTAFGETLPIQGAPFACDAFMFNLHSETPALIWGPRGENAHSNDEFIYVDDFLQLIKMYALTIVNWCGISDQ